jgi:hypothetical protein
MSGHPPSLDRRIGDAEADGAGVSVAVCIGVIQWAVERALEKPPRVQ